jgi:hypothetical protein
MYKLKRYHWYEDTPKRKRDIRGEIHYKWGVAEHIWLFFWKKLKYNIIVNSRDPGVSITWKELQFIDKEDAIAEVARLNEGGLRIIAGIEHSYTTDDEHNTYDHHDFIKFIYEGDDYYPIGSREKLDWDEAKDLHYTEWEKWGHSYNYENSCGGYIGNAWD